MHIVNYRRITKIHLYNIHSISKQRKFSPEMQCKFSDAFTNIPCKILCMAWYGEPVVTALSHNFHYVDFHIYEYMHKRASAYIRIKIIVK